MSKSKTPLLLRIVLLAILLGTAIKIVGLQSQITAKREELASLAVRVQECEAVGEALRQEMENGISEADISEIARTELSYAQPGERVFVDTSSR